MNGEFTLRVTWTDGQVHEVPGLTRRAADVIALCITKLYPEDKVEVFKTN